jgi:hypothetical protein
MLAKRRLYTITHTTTGIPRIAVTELIGSIIPDAGNCETISATSMSMDPIRTEAGTRIK